MANTPILTAADLDALPMGAVIVDSNTVAAQKGEMGWFLAGGHQAYSSTLMTRVLPATILWTPIG